MMLLCHADATPLLRLLIDTPLRFDATPLLLIRLLPCLLLLCCYASITPRAATLFFADIAAF